MRITALKALGQQSALPKEILKGLIVLSSDKDREMRKAAIYALSQQPIWQGYHLLSTEPSFFKDLYTQWLIKRNFQQIAPLYMENDVLFFYTTTNLERITVPKAALFRKAIRQAQAAVGVPVSSRVTLAQRAAPTYKMI